MNKTAHISVLFTALLLVLTVSGLKADQTKWLAIGSLHSWYSSVGCEIELGRTGVFDEQQDGLRWPALYRWQDSQAAKALWIGTRDYQDPTIDKFYNYKVVHVGPRLVDEVNAFMPVEFTLYGKFDHPTVVVDGALASHTTYMDKVDAVDANLPCDRLLVNRVNTSIGVSMQRKIHAFSQQYHDNYFIHDYVFKNTGIYDLDASVDTKTLTGVYFLFQYRIAVCREVGDHGLNYMPQAVDWGHNTLHHVLRGDPYRCFYAWHGLYSKVSYDNIGAPYIPGDGHLGANQFPGVVTIHADVSAGDKSDDPEQPAMTQHIGSDIDITHSQDQYNPAMMTMEYELMSSGHPEQTHAEATGDEFADIGTPGGYSQCFAYGPYDLAPGDSIHIVFAEGVNGLSREMCYEIGAQWLDAYHNPGVSFDFPMPDGSSSSGSYGDGTADQFKNAWTMTGVDSILNTFGRARQHWQNDMIHDPAPPPPDLFNVTSCGDQIAMDWSESAESYAHFGGYHIYRAIHTPDTSFDRIYSCGQGTGNPLIHQYNDKAAQRGFDYYYYITTFDDGTVNTIEPGVPLESSLFWTRTVEPAFLRRPPEEDLADIKIVPNPYNVKARAYQFGESAPDRIMFFNLPPVCTIKIFSERGDLVDTIRHTDGSGDESWNSISSTKQVIVSGIYIVYFETPDGESSYRKLLVIR